MTIVLLADGFEEIEALTPVDILKRAGVEVKTVGISGRVVCGSHNIPIVCDLTPEEVKLSEVSLAIFPGGMPGALNLNSCDFTDKVIESVSKNGGRLAAICAAPFIFGRRGLLAGRRATCFPGFEKELIGAKIVSEPVVTDGNITTASGMGASLAFAAELALLTAGKDKSQKILSAVNSLPEDNTKDEMKEAELSKDCIPENFKKEFKESGLGVQDMPLFSASEEEPEEPSVQQTEAISEDPIASLPENVRQTCDKLTKTFKEYGVSVAVNNVSIGPRVTRYELVPARGTRVSSVLNLSGEIELALGLGAGLTLEAPIPGKTAIGVHIPNRSPDTVDLLNILESEDFKNLPSPSSVCLGKKVDGTPLFADVATFPHMLIAGSPGMGKTIIINDIICSLISKASPEELKLILVDPRGIEFNAYNGIPHLITPVLTEVSESIGALSWAVAETERRYELLRQASVRNINDYNSKIKAEHASAKPLERIVIIFDDYSEVMLKARNPAESLIIRLAQKARAAGIHLILGTHKCSKEIVTGLIKANIPAKISFRAPSARESMLIFDCAGAEKLLDRGDMMVMFASSLRPERAQAAFISDDGIVRKAYSLKSPSDNSQYDSEIVQSIKAEADKYASKSEQSVLGDEKHSEAELLNDLQFIQAVECTLEIGKISTTLLQRKLSIGYGKAAKFIDIMEDMGIISAPNGSKPRNLLITPEGWQEKKKEMQSK